MDLAKVLAQLRTELDHLDAAIESLEHLQEQMDRRSRITRTNSQGRAAGGDGKRGEPAATRRLTRH